MDAYLVKWTFRNKERDEDLPKQTKAGKFHHAGKAKLPWLGFSGGAN